MNNRYGIDNPSGGDTIDNPSGGDSIDNPSGSIDNQSITRPQPLIRSRLRERLRRAGSAGPPTSVSSAGSVKPLLRLCPVLCPPTMGNYLFCNFLFATSKLFSNSLHFFLCQHMLLQPRSVNITSPNKVSPIKL